MLKTPPPLLQYNNRTNNKNKKTQQIDLQKVEVFSGGEDGSTTIQNHPLYKVFVFGKCINKINTLRVFLLISCFI